MSLKIRYLFLPFFLLFCIQQIHAAKSYIAKSITLEDGLSHADANTITQDTKGYIWIGTYSGLDRYDGYEIRNFLNPNPKHNGRILNISNNSKEKIWMLSDTGIQLFDSNEETFIDFNITGVTPDLPRKIILINDSAFIVKDYFSGILFLGSYNDAKKELKINQFDLPEKQLCTDFTKDNNGRIWICTQNKIYIWQNNKFRFVDVRDNTAVSKVLITNDNHLIFTSENSLYYSPYTIDNIPDQKLGFISLADFTRIRIPSNNISDVAECKDGLIAIGTLDGLFLIQKNGSQFEIIKKFSTDSFENTLTSDEIVQLFTDNTGSLWVSTYGGGVNYIDLNTKDFHKIIRKPWENKTLTDNNVAAIYEQDDYIWIGTNTKGVNCYHIPSSKFIKDIIPFNAQNPLKNNIRSLLVDDENRLWIASMGGIDIFDISKKAFETNPAITSQLPTHEITKLQKDCYGQIWGTSWNNGLVKIKIEKDKKINVEYLQKELIEFPIYRTNAVITLYADAIKPILYFSTLTDIVKIKLNENGSIEETTILKNIDKTPSITFVCAIDKQNDSTLWIGTIGNGCYKLQLNNNGRYHAASYGVNKHPLLKDAETVLYAQNGDIWIGGNGLYQLNPQTEKIRRYDFNDGLQSNSFKIHSAYKGDNGRLYFGGIKGMTYFMPEEIVDVPLPSNLIITSIALNNKPLAGLTDQKVSYDKNKKLLSFPYYLNNITIHFSALQFHNQERCQYRYKIEGVDNDWIYTDGRNPQASYSNLQLDKKLTFVVQLYNSEGNWTDISTALNLSVSPPWWASIYAYVFYAICVLLIIAGIFYYFIRMINIKKQLEIKEIEEKQKLEIHQMQLQFFINISHEFRTPLTLIIGSIEKLKKQVSTSDYFNTLKKNAHRLLELINELMDFRRAELGFFKLKVQKGDISSFVTNIAEEFTELADSKNITYEIIDKNQHSDEVWYDTHLLEKIIINIIGNAFKYTELNGEIKVLITDSFRDISLRFNHNFEVSSGYDARSYIYICVSDTGVGISEPSLSAIFNRYYRIEDSEHDRHIGSGIGLTLVKTLTMIHKGAIAVYSERDKGTDFIVKIPVGKEDYTEKEISLDGNTNLISPFINLQTKMTSEDDNNFTSMLQHVITVDEFIEKPTLLIVEDNNEIRKMIADELSEYNILEAKNGMEALQIIEKQIPDLIISDLMMPTMNGIDFCKQVKKMDSTFQIPFIMLTAKGINEGYMESIESGADVYLTKPLETEKLLHVVKNLLVKNQRIKKNVSESYLYDSLKNSVIKKDSRFMSELINIISENLSNSEMNVDFLCEQMLISRTKLYQKVKEQTELSIMDFVKLCRLKKAAQLAAEKNISMTEVMYRVGFQSQSHFSTAFKKEFGKTFSQFIADLKKSNDVKNNR